MSTITINYYQVEHQTLFARLISFSLSSAINKRKVVNDCEGNMTLLGYLEEHKISIWIPNSVHTLNDGKIVLKRWFYDTIKTNLFINEQTAKEYGIGKCYFYTVVKRYLTKKY